MEDYAMVLEFLPSGHSNQLRREPAVQLIGIKAFTLLEATLKPEVSVVSSQKVYVGKDNRDQVDRIKGRIQFSELTNSAREFLPVALRKIIEEREADFIGFINNAKPVSIRVHTLDLLPGIGKKNMESILKEREKQPFASFEDIKKRIPSLTDPVAIFVHRIQSELEGKEKYNLFVKPPAREGEFDRGRFGGGYRRRY